MCAVPSQTVVVTASVNSHLPGKQKECAVSATAFPMDQQDLVDLHCAAWHRSSFLGVLGMLGAFPLLDLAAALRQ